MKWSIRKKAKISFVLLTLMVLTVCCNWRDQQHTKHINRLVHELYEDRLMAENYIHQLADLLHELIANSSSNSFSNYSNDTILHKLGGIMKVYEATNLTLLESQFFDTLKHSLASVEKAKNANAPTEIILHANEGLRQLRLLGRVQIDEGMIMKHESTKLLYAGRSNAQIEMVLVLLTALLLQALVFDSTSVMKHFSKTPQHLN
jgi:hypothetical protein